MGATSETAGHSRAMASASSCVRVDCVPLPIRMPPEVLLPGMTISRLLPMLAICSEILSLAPGSDGQHRDHRTHADDDPEHGQRGAHLVDPEGAERYLES